MKSRASNIYDFGTERSCSLLDHIPGTLTLVVFGCGSTAQAVLSMDNKGNFFTINWGYDVMYNNSSIYIDILNV